jgi:hypothetical protein
MEETVEETEWPTTYMVISKTTEFPGGGSSTMTRRDDISFANDIGVDATALALIPIYEAEGYDFEYVEVVTQQSTKYDPRDS